jgi:hypothetical protein
LERVLPDQKSPGQVNLMGILMVNLMVNLTGKHNIKLTERKL